ncbi:RNA ligase 1 and tail fiber attachment catalyst [Klebsiella phage CPRSB]|nr:RNA ligase 1 and tail fiber attachment catalyst [Klebsiella phage CPRSB]
MKYFEETDPQKLVSNRIIEMMVKNYDQFIPESTSEIIWRI